MCLPVVCAQARELVANFDLVRLRTRGSEPIPELEITGSSSQRQFTFAGLASLVLARCAHAISFIFCAAGHYIDGHSIPDRGNSSATCQSATACCKALNISGLCKFAGNRSAVCTNPTDELITSGLPKRTGPNCLHA